MPNSREAALLRPSGRAWKGRGVLALGALGAVAAIAAALLVPSDGEPPRLRLGLEPPNILDDLGGIPTTTASVSSRAPAAGAGSSRIRALPGPGTDTASQAEPYRIAWPFDIADGITFGPEGATKTRLAGLEGPARDAVCNDREGRPWACGLQARAALNNITRQQKLVCDPAGAPSAAIVPARCRGEVDVARELVLAGFARPTGPEPALDTAVEEARGAERGLWNGGWTIRTAIR